MRVFSRRFAMTETLLFKMAEGDEKGQFEALENLQGNGVCARRAILKFSCATMGFLKKRSPERAGFYFFAAA